jgi:hypothetical protein
MNTYRVISQDFDKSLAFSNCVFYSPDDVFNNIRIKDYVFKAKTDKRVASKCIAMNSFQRKLCNVVTGDTVTILSTDTSSIPVITKVILQLETISKKAIIISEDSLTEYVGEILDSFVFNVGQVYIFH